MNKKYLNNILYILSIISLILGIILMIRSYRTAKTIVDEKIRIDTIHYTDTILQRDTITTVQPQYISKVYKDTLVKYVKLPSNSVYLAQCGLDTLKDFKGLKWLKTDTLTDTIEIPSIIPIEQRYYRDSTYELWASGYEPTIDSIKVYPTTQLITNNTTTTITKTKKPKFTLSVGPYAGYGFAGKRLDYGIGITFGYSIWSK